MQEWLDSSDCYFVSLAGRTTCPRVTVCAGSLTVVLPGCELRLATGSHAEEHGMPPVPRRSDRLRARDRIKGSSSGRRR